MKKIKITRSAYARLNQIKITSSILQKTARVVLPFYKKIARDQSYAERWSRAVRNANLGELDRLAKKAISGYDGIGSSSSDYFVDVTVPKIEIYTNGTGVVEFVQSHFNTRAHRTIAKAIEPLYQAIINSQPFAKAIVEAIRRKDIRVLNQIIRTKVKSPYLQTVEFNFLGFSMIFKFPFEKYTYWNSFWFNAPTS